MDERVTVGLIGRPHGLAGEVYVRSESDTSDRFRPGVIFLTDEQPGRRLEMLSSRYHQGKLLVTFADISDRNEAESLRGVGLTIDAEDRRNLDEDEYWPDQLIGLIVEDEAGRAVGTVASVETDGPQDRLVVRTTNGRLALVPFVKELVPDIRIEEGRVVIHPIAGLLNPSPE